MMKISELVIYSFIIVCIEYTAPIEGVPLCQFEKCRKNSECEINPTDCTTYLECVNFVPTVMPCPDGTYSNPNYTSCNNICDNYDDSACNKTVSCSPVTGTVGFTQPPSALCPYVNDTWCNDGDTTSDASSCDQYYECDFGVWKIQSCNDGLLYNIYESSCSYKSDGIPCLDHCLKPTSSVTTESVVTTPLDTTSHVTQDKAVSPTYSHTYSDTDPPLTPSTDTTGTDVSVTTEDSGSTSNYVTWLAILTIAVFILIILVLGLYCKHWRQKKQLQREQENVYHEIVNDIVSCYEASLKPDPSLGFQCSAPLARPHKIPPQSLSASTTSLFDTNPSGGDYVSMIYNPLYQDYLKTSRAGFEKTPALDL